MAQMVHYLVNHSCKSPKTSALHRELKNTFFKRDIACNSNKYTERTRSFLRNYEQRETIFVISLWTQYEPHAWGSYSLGRQFVDSGCSNYSW